MSNWIKRKIRAWLMIDSDIERAISAAERAANRVNSHIEELERFTALDADVSFRGNCTIILTGVYRGQGYVQFYDLSPEHFREYVERLKYERGENVVRVVDRPLGHSGSFYL